MKYTPQQLKHKAIRALAAKNQGDPRWLHLVMTMTQRTGLSPRVIESRIRGLAA